MNSDHFWVHNVFRTYALTLNMLPSQSSPASMKARTPGLHNLRPEIFYEQIEDLRKIGIDLFSGLELALAQAVIINTFGGEFWAKECTSFGDKQAFFAKKGDVRIVHLAHMLWCLKDQEGFPEFLERNKKGEFESAYYEVTAAHWFFKMAESIRFVIPSGVKSSDFDIEVRKFPSYSLLNVEIKARQRAFATEKQIADLFKKARKQLPEDGQGVIFCKIELSETLAKENFIRAAQNCLKTSNRISFIVYCWDTWNLLEEGIALAYKAIDKEGEINSIFGKSSTPIRPAFLVDAIDWHQTVSK